YELSFEIRLSVSKSPFGSESCSLSAAKPLTVCVVVRTCDVAAAKTTTSASRIPRFALFGQSSNPAMVQFCNTIDALERPFSVTLVFPDLDDPEFPKALELARRSADFGRDAAGYHAGFGAGDVSRLLDVFTIVGRSNETQVIVDGQHVPYGRELWMPLVNL